MASKIRITVKALSQIDGSFREVVANVMAENEQAAVDRLFAIAKDEVYFQFLGSDGVINPSNPNVPPFVPDAKYGCPGEWWSKF